MKKKMTFRADYGICRWPTRLWTVDQYHRAIEHGILLPEDGCELLSGWIVERPMSTPREAYSISALMNWLGRHLSDDWRVGGRYPITMPESEPEPDIVVFTGEQGQYWNRHPNPSDVVLVVEVCESTWEMDFGEKLRLFATHGIEQYWIVNIPEHRVEVYTDPQSGKNPRYQRRIEYATGTDIPLTLAGQIVGTPPVSEFLA